ncbi:unnamed protein product [Paramecium octaurelia]|uniref:Uncharacterized protein n=1 Tax=Paramecium octaurelia TaxID=43137 RepID=A0A8S1TBZ0_PAROT|nr:unnamed protein product [Paramecium octaurelia]
MQIYNNLKQQFQETKRGFSLSPEQGLCLTQNKPPLVESRSMWNKNVYLVPKWEKRDIKHVESNNHTPFPIRNYINYVQQHSEGFSNSLNLDFLKHLIRHFTVNQWWIDQTKKFKRTIPINILQMSSKNQVEQSNLQLLIQKSFDDLNFYNKILSSTKLPPIPLPQNQLHEYKSSVTYQVLDLTASEKYKDYSLFQLQDLFIKRIMQLLSERGLQSLGYYDYFTFQKIVEDQKKGICDAETFMKVLEIKRLFNQIDLISQQNEYITNQWESEDQKNQIENPKKFRRWNQEITLLSDEILGLANYVGLDANLKRARKNYELHKTEHQFNELIIIGDQISATAQKIILDTQSKLSKFEYEVVETVDQIQKDPIDYNIKIAPIQQQQEIYQLQDKKIEYFNTESSRNFHNVQIERFHTQRQKPQEDLIQNNIQKQTKSFHSPQQLSTDRTQFSNQKQTSKSKISFNTPPQKRSILISENALKPQNPLKSQQQQYRKFHYSSNERKQKITRLDEHNEHSLKQNRNLQSQRSQQSLRSYEEFIRPTENISSTNLPPAQLHNFHTTSEINQNLSSHQNKQSQIITSYNSISLHQNRKNAHKTNDLRVMKDYIKKNKKYQTELEDKLVYNNKNIGEDDFDESKPNPNFNQVNESYDLSDDLDLLPSITQRDVKPYDPQIQENEIYNSIPESTSNNTTARTLRNTSNYNSVHPKKQKQEHQPDQPKNDKHEQLQTINEISRKISPVLIRQSSIKNDPKNTENQSHSKPSKDLQGEKPSNQIHSQPPEIFIHQEPKHDEMNNNNYSQNSIDLPSQRARNPNGINEKSKNFLKSSIHFSDKQQIQKDHLKVEITNRSQEHQQENKRSKNKFVKQEVIDDPLEDESEEDSEDDEIEVEQVSNVTGQQLKRKKKAKVQSLSTSKLERMEDHKRYLKFLKEELKEMLDKKVNLKEIKEHINIILSEIGSLSLDQELDYYIQLYKSRAQELNQVNQESHEIRFQNQQPVVELRLKREIKGLKFAKDCDRITKLKPTDLEDMDDTQNLIKIEEEFNDQDFTTNQYAPQYRYESRPSPLQTNIIQVSLDVTRSQTPNQKRMYRTNPRFESDLTTNNQKKKTAIRNTKKQKQSKHIQQHIAFKKEPLNHNFPYLNKYKPELLKSVLEARISLEQLI